MAMTLITTNTSSDASDSAFTSSIDSTYKLYIFKFYDVGPADDDTGYFGVQFNASGQSGYNETITSTYFRALHAEDDSAASVSYDDGRDLAQGTGYVNLTGDPGGGSDESTAGELFLFNPSNTTYVKHFYATVNGYRRDDKQIANYIGGYINVTAAIVGVNFKFSAGNFDGVIKMYGVG